ncbi:MAG: branched-chain amino acid ABC transporter permease [Hyphomicrobiales bacterium]|nr:MAG: branched-chain amino acid ABC transporter permease [Hyphomicrobiales bacterium]
MFSPEIVMAAVLNGVMTGSVYALIALGLTLVYGVLHIINFAHGAMLTAAMFAVFVGHAVFRIDPYAMIAVVAPLFFALGYALQRWVIGPAAHGSESNVLLVTLGLSIMIENALLAGFRSDTRSIDVPYAFSSLDLGFTFLSVPRLVAFGVSIAVAFLLWLLLARTDAGKAIRAVAKEPTGAELVGIRVEHVFAVTFGLGAACVAVAACLLMPTFYVSPRIGNAFVLVAFTIVVLGGMGSIPGAVLGALFVGVVESLSGLFFNESLAQLGVFLIFILVLLLRPRGLFGAKA